MQKFEDGFGNTWWGDSATSKAYRLDGPAAIWYDGEKNWSPSQMDIFALDPTEYFLDKVSEA